ncbi:cell wall protein RBR3 isoform X2 [Amborella trichopoda]|uniref:cell wall protein RBR3 isoform X2 n=1 Tax=Amborella trichopoda TaxID=13333 RepID=UPI0009BD7F8A|nr:cell wall protein RBR3 isoform X2 [Amborella trichopoda]|eukprot:XP_020526754.1 cell wall protein RBR3 isoform X2 [Amborella trichopoda]
MDSLLASYASSSDEEEEKPEEDLPSSKTASRFSEEAPSSKPTSNILSLPPTTSKFGPLSLSSSEPTSIFSSLPPPKSNAVESDVLSRPTSESSSLSLSNAKPTSSFSSLFSSLPPPKFDADKDGAPSTSRNGPFSLSSSKTSSDSTPKSSSLFSSLPTAKFNDPSFSSFPKKVVLFTPPSPFTSPPLKTLKHDGTKHEGEDDEEDDLKKPSKSRTKSPPKTHSSGITSFLPPPKNTLGLAPLGNSTQRRSMIETEAPAPDKNATNVGLSSDNSTTNMGFSSDNSTTNMGFSSESLNYASEAYGSQETGYPNWVSYEQGSEYSSGEYYAGNYENYRNNGSGVANWADNQPESLVENVSKLERKRGRNEIPLNVIEVKQDQLISKRPREDQVNLTGIAFGPAYQENHQNCTKGNIKSVHCTMT